MNIIGDMVSGRKCITWVNKGFWIELNWIIYLYDTASSGTFCISEKYMHFIWWIHRLYFLCWCSKTWLILTGLVWSPLSLSALPLFHFPLLLCLYTPVSLHCSQEDVKSLTAHIVENYWKALEDVDYVQTFKGLKLRYEQQRERQDNPKLDRWEKRVLSLILIEWGRSVCLSQYMEKTVAVVYLWMFTFGSCVAGFSANNNCVKIKFAHQNLWSTQSDQKVKLSQF